MPNFNHISRCAALVAASVSIAACAGCSRPAERLQRGLDALRSGDAKSAIRQLDKAAKKLAPSAALQYNRGAALFMLGRFDDAEAAFRASLELEPGDLQTTMYLGHTLLKKEKWADARKVFRSAIELADDPSEPLAAMSLADLGEGRPDIARLRLLQVLLGDSGNAVAYYNLARLYEGGLSMPNDACLHYEIFLARAPADSPYRESATEAIARLKAAGVGQDTGSDTTLHRDTARAQTEFAAAEKARSSRKLAEAIAGYSRALAADPLFFDAAYNQGLAYRDRSDMQSAIKSFQKAVDIRPRDTNALYMLALSAYTFHDTDTASQALDMAIARDRTDARMFRLMSCVRAEQKRYSEAREYGEYYILLGSNEEDRAAFSAWVRSLPE